EMTLVQARQGETQARLEGIGRLAGGIAHDFNNLLTVVNGYSELLLEDAQLNETIRDPLQQIRKAGERAAVLTRQLLAFSRKQILSQRVFALNDAIADLLGHLRRVLGADIEVTFSPGTLPGPALADPGKVEEVVFQLALHARDGMPHGGKFTLATS